MILSELQQWEGKDVNLKDISAGMTGILMAMHMCHKVVLLHASRRTISLCLMAHPSCRWMCMASWAATNHTTIQR